MTLIQSTPDASQTSVIVSSDHSWRIDVWNKLPDWTPEEARVSGGRFDPRPVLMVHLPATEGAQNVSGAQSVAGQSISSQTSAMIVHPILEAVLRGQLHSPGDIAALAAGQQKER
jgi:hypothetical protein